MNKNTIRVITIMALIVLVTLIIAHFYYQNINKREDPRVVEAKRLYKDYNKYLKENHYKKVLKILDKIENVYSQVPHYQNSYELGVVYTDKAALFLTLAIFKDSLAVEREKYIPELELPKDSLLKLSETLTKKSIHIYEIWLDKFKTLDKNAVKALIKDDFSTIDASQDKKRIYLQNRIEQIKNAQVETPRRLSVCYTNLGMVKRHRGQYEEAIKLYVKALKLWDKNRAAKNNLNLLLGRPKEEPGILEQLFPPKRLEEEKEDQ
jgi:tetratricopeptide (TPR) repeat protein